MKDIKDPKNVSFVASLSRSNIKNLPISLTTSWRRKWSRHRKLMRCLIFMSNGHWKRDYPKLKWYYCRKKEFYLNDIK